MIQETIKTNLRTVISKRGDHPHSILFVWEKGHRRRFTDVDLMILGRKYPTRSLEYDGLLKMIKRLGPMGLARLIRSSDLTVSYWGDRHSAFFCIVGWLLGRPTIVISGGYDAVLMPEIGYGLGITTKGKIYAKIVFHLSRKIIVNSIDSKKTIVRNYRVAPEKVKVAYHGTDVFGILPDWKYEKKRRRLVMTVGKVSWINLRRKGIETFVRSAVFLPTAEFEVIGEWVDGSVEYLKKIAPTNVLFRTNVTDPELVESYRQAKVVVQASYHEGFGCALAEAMSFGCVPIVSRRGALPEVVGETGYYVEYGSAEGLASAILLAINDEKKARLASERAKRLFTISKRQRQIFEVVEGVMKEL